MLKKMLTALLIAGTVLTLAACNQEDKKQPDVTPDNNVIESENDKTDADAIDYEADLSTERYDGYDYRILVRKGWTSGQYQEESQEDVVADAIFRRNKAVEEKYGITISISESSSGDYEVDALNSVLAGDDAYDIIFAHSRAAFTYAVQGAAYNVLDIDTIHMDKPWWSRNIVENCSLNDRLFVLDGDISKDGLSQAMCLLFNKRIFDEKSFDYPYEMVKDGDWTFDEFAYLVKKGGADLNGDGVMKPEDDQFGFVCFEWGAPISILYTGGQKIYDKDDEGKFALTLYSNKTVELFDEFFRLLNNEACYISNTNKQVDYYDIFKQGRAMMANGSLGSAQELRNLDDDFGILPYPKFSEEDEYSSIINGFAPLALIPITVSDANRTGAITEALCAYGSKYVIPAFYEVSLKTKYARDEESEEMMDLIKDNIVYDIGYVAGGPFQSIGRDLSLTTTHDFASFYASRETSAKKTIAEFNADYGGFN